MLMTCWVNVEEKGRKRRRTGACIIHANALVMVLLSCRCRSKTKRVKRSKFNHEVSVVNFLARCVEEEGAF